ncbi:MAG: ATP-binding protein [Erysipelotrichaceae bacterium]
MMMADLAMHITDLAQNCIAAQANWIKIMLTIDDTRIVLSIEDDGCGMDATLLENVQSAFFTKRTTRNIGLGIPMFKASCLLCDGGFLLESEVGKGTLLTGWYQKAHWDLPPMGNLGASIVFLLDDPNCNIEFYFKQDKVEFTFSKQEVYAMLEVDHIDDWETKQYLIDFINEQTIGG